MITWFNVKKWWRMLRGKSLLHVHQNEGKFYSKSTIAGYYNDLTEKVLLNQEHYNEIVPFPEKVENGSFYFPVAIFQYGLGAYDLYLSHHDEDLMKNKIIAFGKWAIEHQEENGLWDAFSYLYPGFPYGAMAQGEGASFLLRVYQITKEDIYLDAAKKALDAMLNHTALIQKDSSNPKKFLLLEFMNKPVVYNGWIFSLFGLYDGYLAFREEKYLDAFRQSSSYLADKLKEMDCGYWSMYSESGAIASPFYHRLHIALLNVMADLTEDKAFKEKADLFDKYQKSRWNRARSFVKKAWQKIWEK